MTKIIREEVVNLIKEDPDGSYFNDNDIENILNVFGDGDSDIYSESEAEFDTKDTSYYAPSLSVESSRGETGYEALSWDTFD